MATRWNSAVEAADRRKSVYYKLGIGELQPHRWIPYWRAQIEHNHYRCSVTIEKGNGSGAVYFWTMFAAPNEDCGRINFRPSLVSRRVSHTVLCSVVEAAKMNRLTFEKWLRKQMNLGWQAMAKELEKREEIWLAV